jgi:excisionase family DNA binding protein
VDYNAEIETLSPLNEDAIDRILDALPGFGPTITTTPHGLPALVLTVQAETLEQATTTAFALAAKAGIAPAGISVLTTEEFDRRTYLPAIPPLLSVTQAAQQLGISPQAIRKQISNHAIAHVKVGDAYVIPAAAIARG